PEFGGEAPTRREIPAAKNAIRPAESGSRIPGGAPGPTPARPTESDDAVRVSAARAGSAHRSRAALTRTEQRVPSTPGSQEPGSQEPGFQDADGGRIASRASMSRPCSACLGWDSTS